MRKKDMQDVPLTPEVLILRIGISALVEKTFMTSPAPLLLPLYSRSLVTGAGG